MLFRSSVLGEIDTLTESREKEQKERDGRWERERLEQIEKEKPLLDEMYKKAQELRTQIPWGHREVTITKTGDLDGDDILEYTCEGVKLSWRDIVYAGTASAFRPGAMGAFASIRVASIDPVKLNEIKAKNQAEIDTKNTKIQAEKTRIENLTSEAKNTGQKQLINKWVTNKCMNHNDSDCSFDAAGEYVYPDGSRKTEYSCCY